MQLDFLKNFDKRMKSIGAYALLFYNSFSKGTWKKYGFDTIYEQTNIIFATILYIMEQSLKDEICTLDDIGNYIDVINMMWLKKPLSYEECKDLGDFIVNVILCDEGRAMYFQGFDYEAGKYKDIHISFIANKIVYIDGDVRRTSYYLTEDGYNLMLSTLELESNMKLTIQEMIFKLHLEKASYDKAVDDIKQIFNLLRIQFQKIQEAMRRIRQNALQFSIPEYSQLLDDNLSTIDETKKKFIGYRDHVQQIIQELEIQDIHVEKLELKDATNLKNLKIIEGYLLRALDEHQKILSSHFDLKDIYTRELESLSQMSLIKRFSFRNEFYDKVLKNPESLDFLDVFLRPLFQNEMLKSYNLGKTLEYQKPIKEREIEEAETLVDFDSEAWIKEQNERLKQRMKVYKDSLLYLLEHVIQYKQVSLLEIKKMMDPQDEIVLLPGVEIFREIMVELLKNQTFHFDELRKEKQEHFSESPKGFQINLCLLEIIDENQHLRHIKQLTVMRSEDGQVVEFANVRDDFDQRKRVRCSNLIFTAK